MERTRCILYRGDGGGDDGGGCGRLSPVHHARLYAVRGKAKLVWCDAAVWTLAAMVLLGLEKVEGGGGSNHSTVRLHEGTA